MVPLCLDVLSAGAMLKLTVAFSAIEAEYIIATETMKEAVWLQGLVDVFGTPLDETLVYCNNQTAIHIAKNQMYHEWTKHI